MTVHIPAADLAPPVELLSVEKRFANGVLGLEPTTLRVKPGEFVTIIGPSGCGKSTLLRIAGGLDEPSDGRVWWWRGPFARVGEETRRLAFVFQDPTLMPWASVAANVRLPLDLAGVPSAEANARVAEALAEIALTDRATCRPRELSGGMRMRTSIARALVTDPDLLLMDEPFAALDEISRNRLDERLLQLSAERGLTTLFVTHSTYEAAFLSTRVIVMAANPGRIFAEHIIDDPLPRGEAYRLGTAFADHARELTRLLTAASHDSRDQDL
jgi:NitT/TauT family transport system ATP-binding protein